MSTIDPEFEQLQRAIKAAREENGPMFADEHPAPTSWLPWLWGALFILEAGLVIWCLA